MNTSTLENLKIRDVKTILTAPDGINLIVVKVETNEPGLYGIGCATFTQRFLTVKSAIDDYIKPFAVGKDPQRIEDIWQSAMVNGYWRNGPVLNNAISGLDMALWDIKGKIAGMPVYQLLGGKSRDAVAVYRHADGISVSEVEENVIKYMEQGYHYIRCQLGGYGGKSDIKNRPETYLPGNYYDPDAYVINTVKLFDHIRSKIGFDVELLHDVHERVAPIEAVRLAKQLEPYRLFFLEDCIAPENIEWLKMLRSQSATPIALGELFNNIHEWKSIIKDQLIDFIRVHISQIGGITPAKKLASLCECFGVRTAWQGPGDVSPVGHAANLTLDISCNNFGIQEWAGLESEKINEVFPGCPIARKGYVYLNDKPGLGIDVDEEKAKKYPCVNNPIEWTVTRINDGTLVRP
jgi:mannonate dehydratase